MVVINICKKGRCIFGTERFSHTLMSRGVHGFKRHSMEWLCLGSFSILHMEDPRNGRTFEQLCAVAARREHSWVLGEVDASEDARCFAKGEDTKTRIVYSMINGVFKLFSTMVSKKFWDKWLPNSQLRMRWWQRFAAWRTWGSWVPMLCHRVAWPFPLSVPCWPFDLLDMYGLLVCLFVDVLSESEKFEEMMTYHSTCSFRGGFCEAPQPETGIPPGHKCP